MINVDYDEDTGEEIYSLDTDGKRVVCTWVARAFEADEFDWDLIFEDDGPKVSPEALAERYRLLHWLNEMDMLAADIGEGYNEYIRDEEPDYEVQSFTPTTDAAMCLLAVFIAQFRNAAKRLNVSGATLFRQCAEGGLLP